MKRANKIVAIACIFSTLIMGCYSSALIDPKEEEKEGLLLDRIESLVMKDGTSYVFDYYAVTVNEKVVGIVNGRQVFIPLSDVQSVQVSSFNTALTLILVGGIAGLVIAAVAVSSFAVPGAVM